MILSDRTIREELARGRLAIDPFNDTMVQPSSVDLRLDRRVLVFREGMTDVLDVRHPTEDFMEVREHAWDQPIILRPREFVLGSTIERVTLPEDLVGRLEGRSSLGRLGIVIHSTAGYIDPGFSGRITLEISNLATVPVALYPGMRIAQISFIRMTSPAEVPYGQKRLGSKYQGQEAPTPSRLYLDFHNSQD